jgi:hypothetical protein
MTHGVIYNLTLRQPCHDLEKTFSKKNQAVTCIIAFSMSASQEEGHDRVLLVVRGGDAAAWPALSSPPCGAAEG